MSPSSTTSSYFRTSVSQGEGPVSLGPERIENMKAKDKVFPHLADLQDVVKDPDIDLVTTSGSLKKVIEAAELAAKTAETDFDFGQYDQAYWQHLRATRIMVDLHRHPDSPSLAANDALKRLRDGVIRRLKEQHSRFIPEAVKIIEENNARNGTQPTKTDLDELPKSKKQMTNGHHSSNSIQDNGFSNVGAAQKELANGHSLPAPAQNGLHRSKPPVKPKPDALHGKATLNSPTSPAQDISARFAKLRSPVAAVQDPRIRTQPIPIIPRSLSLASSPASSQTSNFPTSTRPDGPQDMPSVPTSAFRSKIGPLDTKMSGMPRQPAAIYSPAQSDHTNNLPSSISRNMSYFGNVARPVSTSTPTPGVVDSSFDYFSLSHKASNSSENMPPSVSSVVPPGTTTVTVEDFLEWRKHNWQILFVDVRSRDEFNKGHIVASSIICIEPIILRRAISADHISESLVLSPDAEQILYAKRSTFDLVIFYDQSSRDTSSVLNGQNYLDDFSSAIYEYAYENRTKRRPILLVGGLDAWVSVMGANSLSSMNSGTLSAITGNSQKRAARDPVRVTTKEDLLRKAVTSRAKIQGPQTILDNPVSKLETFPEEIAPNDDLENFEYAKTTEDFFRRYPAVSTQESMISSKSANVFETYSEELPGYIPSPPTRPPPALPRTSSRGISERGPTTTFAHTGGSGTGSMESVIIPGRVGLGTYGAQCYVNSVIQCLSANTSFKEFFLKNEYPPVVSQETGEPVLPNLSKQLNLLLRCLWSDKYRSVKPTQLWVCTVWPKGFSYWLTIFQRYINQLWAIKQGKTGNCPPDYQRTGICGTSTQHDVEETFLFILDELSLELNPNRSQPHHKDVDAHRDALNARLNRQGATSLDVYNASLEAWKRHELVDNSFISKHFVGQTVTTTVCNDCQYTSRKWTEFTNLNLPFPRDDEDNTMPRETVIRMFEEQFTKTEIIEMRCELGRCQDKDETAAGKIKGGKTNSRNHTQSVKISRWPEYLTVMFNRFGYKKGEPEIKKIKAPIEPLEADQFLDKFAPPLNGTLLPPNFPKEMNAPFSYKPYGAIYHSGETIHGGHYIARTRSLEPELGNWYRFSDDSPVRPWNSGDDKHFQVVMLFMKRI